MEVYQVNIRLVMQCYYELKGEVSVVLGCDLLLLCFADEADHTVPDKLSPPPLPLLLSGLADCNYRLALGEDLDGISKCHPRLHDLELSSSILNSSHQKPDIAESFLRVGVADVARLKGLERRMIFVFISATP